MSEKCEHCVFTDAKNDRYRKALEEIALSRGPYSRDPLKHAENVIKAMVEEAKTALVEGEK